MSNPWSVLTKRRSRHKFSVGRACKVHSPGAEGHGRRGIIIAGGRPAEFGEQTYRAPFVYRVAFPEANGEWRVGDIYQAKQLRIFRGSV